MPYAYHAFLVHLEPFRPFLELRAAALLELFALIDRLLSCEFEPGSETRRLVAEQYRAHVVPEFLNLELFVVLTQLFVGYRLMTW